MNTTRKSDGETGSAAHDLANQLDEQRRVIDRLDGEMLRLFNERLEVAARIGASCRDPRWLDLAQ